MAVRQLPARRQARGDRRSGGTGKGFFVQQMLAHLAAGKDFFGHACPGGPQKPLYVSCEDEPDDIRETLAELSLRWSEAERVDMRMNFQFLCVDDNPAMMEGDKRAGWVKNPTWDEFEKSVRRERFAAVALDTYSRIFPFDANDNSEAAKAATLLACLSRDTGATVITIDHYNKSEGGQLDLQGSPKSNTPEALMERMAIALKGTNVLGASQKVNNARFVINLFPFSEGAAQVLFKPQAEDEDDLGSIADGTYLAAGVAKMNRLAPQYRRPIWLKHGPGGVLLDAFPDRNNMLRGTALQDSEEREARAEAKKQEKAETAKADIGALTEHVRCQYQAAGSVKPEYAGSFVPVTFNLKDATIDLGIPQHRLVAARDAALGGGLIKQRRYPVQPNAWFLVPPEAASLETSEPKSGNAGG
ncbi:MAG: AAA family ATPase [Deltaproteobacteria bacterium]|nr:AAA family ATPase [Deltaproteobacteria bacterium]